MVGGKEKQWDEKNNVGGISCCFDVFVCVFSVEYEKLDECILVVFILG